MWLLVSLNLLTIGWMDFLDFPSPLQEAVAQHPNRFWLGKLYPGQSLPLCCTMPAGDFQEQPGVCGVFAMYFSMNMLCMWLRCNMNSPLRCRTRLGSLLCCRKISKVFPLPPHHFGATNLILKRNDPLSPTRRDNTEEKRQEPQDP